MKCNQLICILVCYVYLICNNFLQGFNLESFKLESSGTRFIFEMLGMLTAGQGAHIDDAIFGRFRAVECSVFRCWPYTS